MPRARAVLDSCPLLTVPTSTFERAADLDPDLLGGLDAVHLAAALELGDDRLVSYDERMTRVLLASRDSRHRSRRLTRATSAIRPRSPRHADELSTNRSAITSRTDSALGSTEFGPQRNRRRAERASVGRSPGTRRVSGHPWEHAREE